MSTSDTVCKELQTLKAKLEDLKTSKSKVLRKLSESNKRRLESPMLTTITDLQSTILSLKTQSENRDQELGILRERTSALNKTVNQLSRRIPCLKKQGIPVYQNKSDSKSNETYGLPWPTLKEGPTSMTLELPNSVIDLSEKSEPQKKRGSISSTNSTGIRTEKKSQELPPKPLLTRNYYGLKCRLVSTVEDNRVKCLEDRDRELFRTPLKSTSLDTDDKLNLPTRDECKKLLRTKKAGGTKSKSKPCRLCHYRSPHRQATTRNEFRNLAGLNKDPNDEPDVKDLNSWKTLAEIERRKGLSMSYLKTGKGPDTCLLLDLSGSMVGEPFNEMMVAVRTFVEGIATVSAALGIEENIGIATFGEQTGVIQHMTNDYDKVREALELLVPSGPSPMAAGLYMALACCLGHDSNTHIGQIPLRCRIIMFTDGKGTLDTKTSGDDDFESPLDFLKSVWLKETAADLEKRSIRVYTVSVCSTEPASLEEVSKTTHGKMYKSTEVHMLVKMTQNMAQAANMIENGLDFTESSVDNPGVAEKIIRYTNGEDWEDIVLLGKFMQRNSNFNNYTELEDSNLPPLGSRVRRKPGWRYGDQDMGRPGTVIGHDKDRMSVWVEWDHGKANVYKCHALFGQDVILVEEPRILKDEIIAVGCFVERGDDWNYGDQDGGIGSVGVVLNVNANGLIIVRWPDKSKGRYKFGFDGLFDVKLCDKVNSQEKKGMPSQAAEAEKTEAYLSSDSSSGQLEHQDIFNRELTKDDNSKKARTNPMSIEDFNERNRRLQMNERNEASAVEVAWAYKKDGKWYNLPRAVIEKVEKAYGRNKQGSTILELDGCIWRASFSDMKMVCQKTHAITEIARNGGEFSDMKMKCQKTHAHTLR